MKKCDFKATIPMKGKINSLNVSAAVSAILFERQRQLNKDKEWHQLMIMKLIQEMTIFKYI